MRSFLSIFVASAFLLISVNADLEKASNNHSLKQRRAVLAARDLENTALPESVKRDIMAMDPDDYQLFPRAAGDNVKFNPGGAARDNVNNWVNGHGPRTGNCVNGKVALTYDDGPFTWTKNVSDQFTAAGAHANFFFNGNNWGCSYDKVYVQQMRAVLAAGHTIGTHTWGHVNLTNFVTPKQIDTQIELMEELLWKTVGVIPSPYGETNKTVIKYLEDKHHLHVVQWSDNNGDADGDTPETSIEMYKTFKAGERHLILGHEVKEPTVGQIIPFALDYFKKLDVTPVSLQDCLKGHPSPYKAIGKHQKRDDTWTCAGKPAPGQVE